MSGEAGTPQKVCVVCKQDCSTRKRSRDDLGRYTCQDCLDKAARATGKAQVVVKSASAAVPAGARPPVKSDGASLGALGAEPLPSYLFEETPVNLAENEKFCNSCGKVMKKNAVLCTTCGKNQETGKSLHTVLKKPEVVKDKRRSRGGGFDLDGWPALVFPLVGLAFGTTYVLSMVNDGDEMVRGISGIGTWLFILIASICVIVHAFTASILWGIGAIFIPFVGLYYAFAVCESRFVKYSYAAAIPFIVALRFVMRFS
jgi:hypothetical protein